VWQACNIQVVSFRDYSEVTIGGSFRQRTCGWSALVLRLWEAAILANWGPRFEALLPSKIVHTKKLLRKKNKLFKKKKKSTSEVIAYWFLTPPPPGGPRFQHLYQPRFRYEVDVSECMFLPLKLPHTDLRTDPENLEELLKYTLYSIEE